MLNLVCQGSDRDTHQSPVQPGFPVHLLSVSDQIETATGDHLRSALPTVTTAFLGSSQTMEQGLDLVILTCDALFQGVDAVLDLLGLFTLQLDKRLAVEVDLVV